MTMAARPARTARARRRARRAEAGFSLIELAIVLAIMGLIAAGGLGVLGGSLQNSQLRTTQARLTEAVAALSAFQVQYNRLPCPADGSLTAAAGLYGREQGSPGNCGAIVAASRANGVLPGRALGLGDEASTDGWSRRLSYRVSPALTAASGAGGAGVLDIRFQDSAGTTTQPLAAFAIFSHGRNGLGGWSGQTGTRLTTTGAATNEAENLDADDIYVAPALVPPGGDAYDDRMVWRTGAQLAQLLGLMPAAACTSADTVLASSTYACSGTPTDANVCAVANAVNIRCP